MSTFLDRLKQAMNESGATKTDLWKACDISSGAVSQWFSKPTTQLKGKNLLCVARVLGVNPDWLETGEGNKKLEDDDTNKKTGQDSKTALTPRQKRILELANNLKQEDLKSWLKYAEAMAGESVKKSPTANAVDTKQAKTIESQTDRRTGEQDRRKADLGFNPERRHFYGAPSFPQKDKTYTDRRRKKNE